MTKKINVGRLKGSAGSLKASLSWGDVEQLVVKERAGPYIIKPRVYKAVL